MRFNLSILGSLSPYACVPRRIGAVVMLAIALLLLGPPDGAPRPARAAGAFRMIVPGLAADSVPPPPPPGAAPAAWVLFKAVYEINGPSGKYTIAIESRAPVWTSSNAVLTGSAPVVGGPTWYLPDICSADPAVEDGHAPLKTYGVAFPTEPGHTGIKLSIDPPTYRWHQTIRCPVPRAPVQEVIVIQDTLGSWVQIHEEEGSPAGGFLVTGFTAPHQDARGFDCTVARKQTHRVKEVGGISVDEDLYVFILSSATCLQ